MPTPKLLWVAAAPLLLWAAVRWFERVNLYHPAHGYDLLPTDYGIPYEDISFTAEDGASLHGWLTTANVSSRSKAAVVPHMDIPLLLEPVIPSCSPLPPSSLPLTVVVFHGNAGNLANRIQKLRIFRQLGVDVLLFEYRGYGRSRGRPTERGTYLDGQAAVDWLSRRGVPLERMVFYGESLGCAVALETALRRPPAALILDSGFTSTIAMGKAVFPFLPVRLMVSFHYDNLSKVPMLKAPLLVMHSPDDDIVPYRMGRALFEAAPEPKRFVETRGDHNGGFLETPNWAESIRAFLLERLPPSKTK